MLRSLLPVLAPAQQYFKYTETTRRTIWIHQPSKLKKNNAPPEDMASYIQDSNSLIAEDTQKQIQLYNANWKNAYNQVVAIAITTEDPSESLAKGYAHKWI